MCNSEHHLDKCEEFLKINLDERSKFLARKSLCYDCYKSISSTHNVRNCTLRRINEICQKKYPFSLYGCTTKQKTVESLDTNGRGDKQNTTALLKNNCAQVGDVSCVTTFSGEFISMCVVPIKIRYQNTGKELSTYGVLDSCSQGTFIRKDIGQTLVASRFETQASVRTVNGNQTHSFLAVDSCKQR